MKKKLRPRTVGRWHSRSLYPFFCFKSGGEHFEECDHGGGRAVEGGDVTGRREAAVLPHRGTISNRCYYYHYHCIVIVIMFSTLTLTHQKETYVVTVRNRLKTTVYPNHRRRYNMYDGYIIIIRTREREKKNYNF